MKIIVDLSLTSAANGTRNTWTPGHLFETGGQGAWYDPSDLTSMWADTAGTTPASVDGAVARIDDLSGNGHHASEATPAARPILRQDGSGRHYLEFDGVDDRLVTTTYGFNAQEGFFFAYSGVLLESSGRILNVGGANDKTWTSASGRWTSIFTVDSLDAAGAGFDLTALHVGEHNLQGGQADLTCNGVPGPTATTVGKDIALSDMTIGARSDGAAALAMNLYGFVALQGGADAAQRAKTRMFLSRKTGVTL